MSRKFATIILTAAITLAVISVEAAEVRVRQTVGDAGKTVWNGVYTSEQAARGKVQFGATCARCHESGNRVFPLLHGNAFMDRWREDKLDPLFHLIRTTMPPAAPGALDESAYLDILASILAANSMPAGSEELMADSLTKILFTGKDGPKPLPNLALIRVVGCFTSTSQTGWVLLNRAVEPTRTRNPAEATEQELRSSAAAPLGLREFRLQNFDYLNANFSPEPYVGRKVQVKGVLIRQFDGEYVNPLSLETVASDCSQ